MCGNDSDDAYAASDDAYAANDSDSDAANDDDAANDTEEICSIYYIMNHSNPSKFDGTLA